MEFAFYKESGLLHEIAEDNIWDIDPATNKPYTDEDFDGLTIMTFEEVLDCPRCCKYLLKEYKKEFLTGFEQHLDKRINER